MSSSVGSVAASLHAPDLPQVYRGGFILGHEPGGRIAAVGREVTGWRVGQRVSINPNGDICGVCAFCRTRHFNCCVQATLERAVGLQADGALARHVVASTKTLHAVPDAMGPVESRLGGARCDRTPSGATGWRPHRAIGSHRRRWANRAPVLPAQSPFGAARVWLMEPSPERRALSDASGVDRAFDPKRDASDIDRLGADVVLECSGNEHGARAGLNALAPQGTMIVVGGGAHAGLDPLTILLRELKVHGSFIYVDEFDQVIGLLAGSALRVADLTTEIVGIEEAPEHSTSCATPGR